MIYVFLVPVAGKFLRLRKLINKSKVNLQRDLLSSKWETYQSIIHSAQTIISFQ